jgi:hypothetical protein
MQTFEGKGHMDPAGTYYIKNPAGAREAFECIHVPQALFDPPGRPRGIISSFQSLGETILTAQTEKMRVSIRQDH